MGNNRIKNQKVFTKLQHYALTNNLKFRDIAEYYIDVLYFLKNHTEASNAEAERAALNSVLKAGRALPDVSLRPSAYGTAQLTASYKQSGQGN